MYMSAELGDNFRRFLHDSDTMAEDRLFWVLTALLDGLGMGQANPGAEAHSTGAQGSKNGNCSP